MTAATAPLCGHRWEDRARWCVGELSYWHVCDQPANHPVPCRCRCRTITRERTDP